MQTKESIKKKQKKADKNISQIFNSKESFKEKYKKQQKEILMGIFGE